MIKANESVRAEHEAAGCMPERLAAGVALLQEKWVLSIIYALLRGPNGFNDVGRHAGAVNSATLAQRLARLEQAGIVKKTVQSVMPPRTSYELTEAGRGLKPVMAAIERWSERYAPNESGGPGA